jgi:non-ribosomal peptide synthetase component F
LTTDQITQIDVTVSVVYGSNIAIFRNQLMAGAMSQGGDSGSTVLDMSKRVVGLLFAGSNTTTIMNPIQFVLDALQVQIVTA